MYKVSGKRMKSGPYDPNVLGYIRATMLYTKRYKVSSKVKVRITLWNKGRKEDLIVIGE